MYITVNTAFIHPKFLLLAPASSRANDEIIIFIFFRN